MVDKGQRALADFLSEAQEAIDLLGRELMRLDADGADEPPPDVLNAVFRAAHSLKGLASMFAVERMARLAHALEDLLDDVRMGRRALDRGGIDLLLETPELLARIVGEEAAGEPPRTAEAAARLADRLRAGDVPRPAAAEDPLDAVALGAEVRAVLTEYEEHRLRSNVRRGIGLFRVQVSYDLASFDEELAALTARLRRSGEVVSTLPSADPQAPEAIAFQVVVASRDGEEAVRREAGAGARVERVAHLRSTAAPSPAARAAPAARSASGVTLLPEAQPEEAGSIRSVSQSVRVDIRKLDGLMNLVGELVLVKSSLQALAERLVAQSGRGGLSGELHHANRALERRLAELQERILEVRMVPLEQTFEKLARMVRKIAREVGKEVDLEVEGGEVELDKLIVEELADPLMHLIRNALDHGIEPAEVRARLGKPTAGRVRLGASQKGNHVQVVVEDDGAGVDEARVREVAVERGLATPEAIREMSRRELMNLIFVAGFSTARDVTPLSGRGVGMDVVKNNIAQLSGIIELRTEHGRGTRFEITLPVTLAIVRALVVVVSGRTYAVPLNSVLEIVQVSGRDVRTVSAREVISLRGSTLPLVRLARFLDLPGARAPERSYVVVVGLAQERIGIAVDELVGQQDVVVKPLGAQLQGIRGFAGATDLGSRRTVLVLDVGAIVEDVVGGAGLREVAG